MSDLISRRAAIEAIGECPRFKVKPFWKSYNEGRSDQWFNDVAALTAVSSAQSEIILCKDCTFFDGGICNRLYLGFAKPDCFCSWAERRTDE